MGLLMRNNPRMEILCSMLNVLWFKIRVIHSLPLVTGKHPIELSVCGFYIVLLSGLEVSKPFSVSVLRDKVGK